MEKQHHKKSFIGFIFIIAGLLIIFQQTELIPWEIAQYVKWQFILIAIGMYLLFIRKKLTGGLIMIAIGSILFIPEVIDLPYQARELIGPSILVIIGLIFILKKRDLSNKFGNRSCLSKEIKN